MNKQATPQNSLYAEFCGVFIIIIANKYEKEFLTDNQ